jgi:hypothetical protein
MSCYYAVKNVLSFRLQPKNVKIKIYKTNVLLVCMGLTLGLSPEAKNTD